MDIRDSQRIKEIRDNTAKMADAFTRIADALERLADRKIKPQIDDFFREPTAEERKAVAEYIESISIPTGVNVFDLIDEPQTDWEKEKSGKSLCNFCIKDCDNRKRNLYMVECNRYEPQTAQNITEFQKLCGIKIDPDRINIDCGWK